MIKSGPVPLGRDPEEKKNSQVEACPGKGAGLAIKWMSQSWVLCKGDGAPWLVGRRLSQTKKPWTTPVRRVQGLAGL